MTRPERALRDGYRDATPERRQMMLAQAGSVLQQNKAGGRHAHVRMLMSDETP